jgi:hypothetical protein
MLTGLPTIQYLQEIGFWSTEAFADLHITIQLHRQDYSEIWSSLQNALEWFWLQAPTPFTDGGLETARGHKIVGGGDQDWVDEEELAEFPATLRMLDSCHLQDIDHVTQALDDVACHRADHGMPWLLRRSGLDQRCMLVPVSHQNIQAKALPHHPGW